jgi:hypothetical protein
MKQRQQQQEEIVSNVLCESDYSAGTSMQIV